MLNTVQDVVNQGVIIIAAAGNESSSQPFYPASYESVISVSAVDYASNLAYYSSFGDTIDVAAPGGDASTDLNDDGYGDGVLSTLGNDRSGMIEMGYGFYQGTSMAAPHVAGVVALMKALRPDLTASDLIALLAGGEMTNDIGRAELFGAGLIDAQKAVLVAQSGDLPTLFSVTPSLLSLGAALSAATITVEKIGNDSGELSITDISSDVPWLSVTPEAVDSDGIGTYTITGDRSELTNGTYNGTITFVSNVNTSTMSVSMLVSAAESSPDAGLHHILLIDANDQEAKYVLDVQAQDGVYAFTFTDVEPGDYFLFAGTDLDNDGMLGDSGEVLGAYLSLDKPDKITVDENKSGLDFISTFNNRIGESQPVAIVQRQRPPKTVNGR